MPRVRSPQDLQQTNLPQGWPAAQVSMLDRRPARAAPTPAGLRLYTNVQGDASAYHERNKMHLYVLVPVVESLLQFLVQSVIIYNLIFIYFNQNAFTPLDISSLCFDTSIFSQALYAVQLQSSFTSLCISLTL